jgi:chromosome segregation ATPase
MEDFARCFLKSQDIQIDKLEEILKIYQEFNATFLQEYNTHKQNYIEILSQHKPNLDKLTQDLRTTFQTIEEYERLIEEAEKHIENGEKDVAEIEEFLKAPQKGFLQAIWNKIPFKY